MIKVADDRRHVAGVSLGGLWVGDGEDEKWVVDRSKHISACLCVAQDMMTYHHWGSGLECAHVGLIDGPGNELAAYYAAILTLHTLLRRHNVLVCCHSATRSLAVAIMYLNVGARRGWDGWLEVLHERSESVLMLPHEAHREAFDRLNWKVLGELLR